MNTENAEVKEWGLYDSVDRCWIGNEAGPLVYRAREINGHLVAASMLARTAATVANERMKWKRRRIVARPFARGAFKKKDEVTPVLSGVEAVARIKGRAE